MPTPIESETADPVVRLPSRRELAAREVLVRLVVCWSVSGEVAWWSAEVVGSGSVLRFDGWKQETDGWIDAP